MVVKRLFRIALGFAFLTIAFGIGIFLANLAFYLYQNYEFNLKNFIIASTILLTLAASDFIGGKLVASEVIGAKSK